MKDKKPQKSGKITAEDAELWKKMTKDVKKMPGQNYVEPAKNAPAKKPEIKERTAAGEAPPPRPEKGIVRKTGGRGLDRRTAERLRRGQMEIEARLDLHGMTQDEAQAALAGFIKRCHGRKNRCVLVITGKGKAGTRESGDWFAPEPGVLKRRTPEWLSAADMEPYVLKYVPAQRKDGGDGALYVLLRRHRA